MSLRDRVAAALGSARGPAWAALVALLLALPTLAAGEYLDDHLMRAWARGGGPAWDAFHFVAPGELPELRELGMFGWWASDSLSLRFFRPLSSLTHYVDHALWPDAVWLMHLENVALYALCTALVGRLVARVHGPGSIAGLAALVFAIDAAHGATVGWISARNTILALTLGLAALLCHARWRGAPVPGLDRRSAGSPGWAPLATLCFGASLLAAEGGLCSFGYLLAWALCFERGALHRRLVTVAPYLAVIIAWRLAYTRAGFGAHDSGIYLDLGAEPGLFALRAVLYPAVISAAQLSVPLVDLILGAPALLAVFVALFVALMWALWPLLRSDVRPRFWLLAMLFASVPLAATHPTARTLMLCGVGGAVLVALVWAQRGELAGYARARRAALRVVLLAKLGLAPLAFLPLAFSTTLLEGPHRTLAAELPEQAPLCVVLNVPTEISAFYPRALRTSAGRGWPRPTYTMFAGMDPVEVTRVDEHTLELAVDAGWAARPIDQFSRTWREGFAKGERIQLEQLELEIVEVGPDRRPRRVHAVFAVSIDDVELFGFGRDGAPGLELATWAPAVGSSATFHASPEP